MIAIFGGTFDPIHNGHLRAALEIKELLDVSQVRLIPSATPPHRAQPIANARQRQQMIELAIQNLPNFVCDNRELERTGYSYMVDTLASLRQDFPTQALALCIGTDAFNQLTTWHDWQRLFCFAHIIVMTRPDVTVNHLNDFFAAHHSEHKQELSENLAGKLYFQAITQLAISATAIRQLIQQKRKPMFLLPETVLDFINQQQLYQ